MTYLGCLLEMWSVRYNFRYAESEQHFKQNPLRITEHDPLDRCCVREFQQDEISESSLKFNYLILEPKYIGTLVRNCCRNMVLLVARVKSSLQYVQSGAGIQDAEKRDPRENRKKKHKLVKWEDILHSYRNPDNCEKERLGRST